jgi:toxin CptA
MSIAVSAVVRPSRMLLALIAGMALLVCLSGAVIAFGSISELPGTNRLVIGLACQMLAVGAFSASLGSRKTFRLDISGVGQIRLREYSGEAPCSSPETSLQEDAVVFRLVENSVLWPHLLVVRLQSPGGIRRLLLILSDCTGDEEFRAVSVACRWIAAHNICPPPFDAAKVD